MPCATCDVLTPPGVDPAVERWAHPTHLARLVRVDDVLRACPACGARFTVRLRVGRHVTGEWEEERVASVPAER